MLRNKLLLIILIPITICSWIDTGGSKFKEIKSFRGIKAGKSSFYDALQRLGKPNVSSSSTKKLVAYKYNIFFYYKKIGVKLYGLSGPGFGIKSIKKTKISKIMILK